ncbi:MAG: addiction module protein [Cyanobacteria bacterium SID2]|nr:addiction module protein [Cyanobacteria bacterium SID2]MBP0003645.1 addiction module protein [Cyanobacteria bacterium SBC]
MSDPNFDTLLESALTLSPHLRAILAERLLSSLDNFKQSEVDEAWATEVDRCFEEIQSGTVTPIPGEEVLKALEERRR